MIYTLSVYILVRNEWFIFQYIFIRSVAIVPQIYHRVEVNVSSGPAAAAQDSRQCWSVCCMKLWIAYMYEYNPNETFRVCISKRTVTEI